MIQSMINFYHCRNIVETEKFYTALGLKVSYIGPFVTIFDSGYGYIGFMQSNEFELPKYSCISFNLSDTKKVNEYYQEVKEKFNCTTPALQKEYGVYSFFINDPNGYRVEFQKMLEKGEKIYV